MKTYGSLIPKYAAVSHAAGLPYYTPPGTASLHLGYPDPSTFPAQAIRDEVARVLDSQPEVTLQYCEERGDPQLRSAICGAAHVSGRHLTPDNVMITQGTTDALEIVPQLLIERGDTILMEAPTYLWAIRSFRLKGAELIGIPIDGDGIRIDLLTESLTRLHATGTRPKLLYIMPDFHNPAGVSLSLSRRKDLLAIASEHQMLVLEDSPYCELWYDSAPEKTLFDLDDYGVVISARSFSKVIGPGIRLGWMAGPERLISELVRMRHTGACTLLSRAVSSYVQGPAYRTTILHARELYRRKRDAACRALAESCPPEVKWRRPTGGFYVWLSVPEYVDMERLYSRARERRVLFLRGECFFCDDRRVNSLRLSFSFESEETIYEGARVIGKLLEEAVTR